MIGRIHVPTKHHLPIVIHATGQHSLGLGFGQCGKQHCREYRDNRDDDEQFDESETAVSFSSSDGLLPA